MPRSLEVGFVDYAALEEIELLAALMVAAAESDEPLDQGQIDTIVGISPERTAVGFDGRWLRPAETPSNEIFQT